MKSILTSWFKFKSGRINEAGFPRIVRMLQASVPNVKTIAFLTGENPNGQPLSKAENIERNKNLSRRLRELNYGFVKIRGKFGTPESSFMVPNMSRKDVTDLGKAFEQESVIWGSRQDDKMIFEYIEGDKTIQKRDVVLFGKDVENREDLYSQEKQSAGRKFFIPFFDEDYAIEEVSNDPIPRDLVEDNEYNLNILKEVEERCHKLSVEGKTTKYYWHHRGILNVLVDSIRKNINE